MISTSHLPMRPAPDQAETLAPPLSSLAARPRKLSLKAQLTMSSIGWNTSARISSNMTMKLLCDRALVSVESIAFPMVRASDDVSGNERCIWKIQFYTHTSCLYTFYSLSSLRRHQWHFPSVYSQKPTCHDDDEFLVPSMTMMRHDTGQSTSINSLPVKWRTIKAFEMEPLALSLQKSRPLSTDESGKGTSRSQGDKPVFNLYRT